MTFIKTYSPKAWKKSKPTQGYEKNPNLPAPYRIKWSLLYKCSSSIVKAKCKFANINVDILDCLLYLFKALWYNCTLVPSCTLAMALPIVCIMWLPRQCNLPIVISQWVFTVTSLRHCYAPHFMNGESHLHLENNILYIANFSKTTGWLYSTVIQFVFWILFVYIDIFNCTNQCIKH